MFRDPSAIAFFSDTVVLAKINAEEDTVSAAYYRVSGYPTAILINADGTEIDRIAGYDTTDVYLQMIRDYMNGIGTLDDLLAKIEVDFTREMAADIAEKYTYRAEADDAVIWLNKVIEAGEPRDSISMDARQGIANAYMRSKDYPKAIAEYEKIAEEFAGTRLEEDALIYPGYLSVKAGDTAEGIKRYQAFLKKMPTGEGAEWVQGQIDKLTGKETEEETEEETAN